MTYLKKNKKNRAGLFGKIGNLSPMRLGQRLQISQLPRSLSFHPYPFSTLTLHSPTVCFLDLALLAHWQNVSGCSCKNEGKNIDGLDGEIKHIDIHIDRQRKISVRKILTDKNKM